MHRQHQEGSRTADPSGAPYRREDVTVRNVRVAEEELGAAIADRADTQLEFDVLMGEVEARKEVATRGKLHPPHDDEEASMVRSQAGLREIRWAFTKGPFRLYHAEPEAHEDLLLALKYGWKWLGDGLDAGAIDRRQDRDMAEAARRWQRSPYRENLG